MWRRIATNRRKQSKDKAFRHWVNGLPAFYDFGFADGKLLPCWHEPLPHKVVSGLQFASTALRWANSNGGLKPPRHNRRLEAARQNCANPSSMPAVNIPNSSQAD